MTDDIPDVKVVIEVFTAFCCPIPAFLFIDGTGVEVPALNLLVIAARLEVGFCLGSST